MSTSANRKKTASRSSTKKTTTRSTSSRNTKTASKQNDADKKVVWSAGLFICGLLIMAFTFITGENAWLRIHNTLLGAFGVAVFIVPLVMIYAAVMIATDKGRNAIIGKMVQGTLLIFIFCAAAEIFSSKGIDKNLATSKLIMDLMENGKEFKGGGLFAIVLGIPLLSLFGKAGAIVIIVLLAVFFILLLSNKTIVDVIRGIKNLLNAALDARPEYVPVETKPRVQTEKPARREALQTSQSDVDIPLPSSVSQTVPEHIPVKAGQIGKRHKKLFGGYKDEKPGQNTISEQEIVEEKRKDFDIDIAFPFESSSKQNDAVSAARPSGLEKYNYDPVFDVPDENLSAPVQKSETELEVENYQKQIDMDARRRAYEAQKAARSASEPTIAESAADEKIADTDSSAVVTVKEPIDEQPAPLSEIIKRAAQKPVENRVSETHESLLRKPLRSATLASNKIGDDEDLDLPETTAKDIQNEIAENETIIQEYEIPPIELLKRSSNELNTAQAELEMQENSEILLKTLESFGISAEIVNINRGPTVTRYELLPKAGIKISKIRQLSDDIALRLASKGGIRIEAPIPGKAAVGIEVPNKVKDVVTLRDVLDTDEFRNNKSKLTFAVGKNIDGEIILGDIAKLPHMIIAGTTGSGKSVCTNGIIMSILYNATPQEVRLVLIDPKMVEFKIYNGIPHLLLPVVTDPKKAAGALAWAVQEMLKRYKLFSDNSVRGLDDYNELARTRSDIEPIPRIVIVIDELADLMMAAKGEVEDSICRLAQMARAAGMHIIIATQRPTVDVVTGLIKSNIPSRIALRVASGIDSRTILDEVGAEKLLGNGDLLYFPTGAAKPLRVQNSFTSSKEVAAVVDFIKNGAGNVVYDENIIKAVEDNVPQTKNEKPQDNGKTYEGSDEDVIDRAVECAIDAGSAGVSVTYLQRKLKLGYARAARIMDELQDMGIVGPSEGAKPRQVLVTRESYMAMNTHSEPSQEPYDEES